VVAIKLKVKLLIGVKLIDLF